MTSLFVTQGRHTIKYIALPEISFYEVHSPPVLFAYRQNSSHYWPVVQCVVQCLYPVVWFMFLLNYSDKTKMIYARWWKQSLCVVGPVFVGFSQSSGLILVLSSPTSPFYLPFPPVPQNDQLFVRQQVVEMNLISLGVLVLTNQECNLSCLNRKPLIHV